MSTKPKVLFVLTNHAEMSPSTKPTGWFLPELVHPLEVLKDHAEISFASPKGGQAPLDPASVAAYKEDKACMDFVNDKTALSVTENTEKISSFTDKVNDFAAIFYVGGHGPMYDLAHDEDSHKLIREAAKKDKILAAVCHGPAAFAYAKLDAGSYLIDQSAVTGFSNSEEIAYSTAQYMPFELETVLNEHSGGRFEKGSDWSDYIRIARGGKLITGQNPSSAASVGRAILKAITA